MTRRRIVLPALVLLAAVIGGLVWINLGENLVYYLTPSEAVEQRSGGGGGGGAEGGRFRLGGLVEEGSVEETDGGIRFAVGDGAASVEVVHTGAPPQLFRAGIGVVVEGAWEGALFHSDVLLINHDEQYRAPGGEGGGGGAYEVPAGGA